MFSFLFGLGKSRTELGKWLDANEFSQEDLVNESGVSRNTISKLCSDDDYIPSAGVMRKILKTARMVDPNIDAYDFWEL